MSVAIRGEGSRTDGHPLDNATWAALTGPHHARFAQRVGQAVRYDPEVAVFVAVEPGADERMWSDLAELVGPGNDFSLHNPEVTVPAGWEIRTEFAGVQLTGVGVPGAPEAEAVELGAADVPEMLDLVARTKPGPFRPRTVEMGTYLGIRRGGRLVAMAGERLRPPGWTEISAVCTDPAHRGQGLAGRLVNAVVAGIRERGETPFLHATATNTNAIRLYEAMGFRLRQRTTFRMIRVPG